MKDSKPHPPQVPDWVESPYNSQYKMCRNCHYVGTCRCMWCSLCGQLTENRNKGHFWASCKVTKTDRDFHFCCPDDCQLEEDI